jgi:hypothetical protein
MWQLTKLEYLYSPYAFSMPYMHPLNKMHVVAERISTLLKEFYLVQFFGVIWHLIVVSFLNSPYFSWKGLHWKSAFLLWKKNMLHGTDLHMYAGCATASKCWTQYQKVCHGLVQSESSQQNLWRRYFYAWGRREIHAGFLSENLK